MTDELKLESVNWVGIQIHWEEVEVLFSPCREEEPFSSQRNPVMSGWVLGRIPADQDKTAVN